MVQYSVGNCLHDLDVYHLRCSYGNVRTHTLLGEKKHGPEHKWGVCCRGNIADHGHYRCEAMMWYAPGCGRSVLRAIRCASCHAGCSQSLSLCGAAQYRTRRLTPGPRGSYCSIPSRRWYLLDIVEARLHGEGLSVFSRGVSMYLRQVGVVPILSCMENIPTWVPRCRCYVSVTVDGCNRYGRDG